MVEAETGVNTLPEFRKAQAILCRTYLYNNLNRHLSEGFNLCDEVHCQAYKGQTPFTAEIYKSTNATSGLVITGSDNNLILAPFHGNCGGETETSENTWINNHEYLRPLKDIYCLKSPNSNWSKSLTIKEWKVYLLKNDFDIKALSNAAFEMKGPGRKQYYKVGKDSMLTKQMRADWNLKSSYFQVFYKDGAVILKGHGYGHGVGLCQDGAMRMALLGKNYTEIINYYFKNVKIQQLNLIPK
ncbi:MAG: SpoIID/LytB domain-containing protein [Bacteroidales bacterium]|nr:SpoIID/LytB domain-containing protein [Bacteroidales bacterium]